MKILVAEDETMMLKAIELVLKKEGHEVVKSRDGKEALDIIVREPPDLVVTDIRLPVISGLDIVKTIKSQKGTAIPVIVLSGMGSEEDAQQAFALGADDYIHKPFNIEELVLCIRKIRNRLQGNTAIPQKPH